MAVAASSLPMIDKSEERRVIFASSLGTVFEWYDFYIYATLAPFFARGLLSRRATRPRRCSDAFATYAAGFLVRPFGALVFGRIGDLVGRKYTFLVTIIVMGLSTAAVGLLADLRQRGDAVADDPRAAPPGAGAGARRRVRRRGDLRRRARARRTSAGCTRAGSRPPPRWASSSRWWSSAPAATQMTEDAFKSLGLADSRSSSRSSCW